jgi:tetratricopeptide (TPR) repeat protein
MKGRVTKRLIALLALVALGSLAQVSGAQVPQADSEALPAIQTPAEPGPVEIGNAAFERDDFGAAVAAYTQISPLEIPPDAQNRLGVAYFMVDRERDAEGTYRIATNRDRELPAALNNLGALYYRRGDFGDAEDRFRDALRFDPENPNIQDNLHYARYARENSREARRLAESLGVGNPLLVQRIVGDVIRVERLMSPQITAELADLETRGDIFLARKMFDDAAIEYERSMRLDKYNPMIINKLGLAYLQSQRLSEAERQYKDALRLNPYYLPALNNLGSLEQSRQRYQRAMDYYGDALDIKPDWTIVLQNIGALFFALERYEEGLQVYLQAIRLDPGLFDDAGNGLPTLAQATRSNEAMTNFYMAKVFAATGDRDRTMSFLYRAVEEGFDDAALLTDAEFGLLAEDERFVQLVAAIRS